jgi:hypothetical protein
VFFQIHLSEVLRWVRFIWATLLHLPKILQLLAVRVPELLYRNLKKKYFVLWRRAWWVSCAGVYTRKRLILYYKEKETKYLIIGSQMTDWQEAFSSHQPKIRHATVMDRCCDSLVWISIFHFLNCISMAVHSIWFSMLIFCFSVNVVLCDAVILEFIVSVTQYIGCIQGVYSMNVQLFCVCVFVNVFCVYYTVYKPSICIMYIP